MAFICIGFWELPEDGPQAPGGQHLREDLGLGSGGGEQRAGRSRGGVIPDAPESGQKGTGFGPGALGALPVGALGALPLALTCGPGAG